MFDGTRIYIGRAFLFFVDRCLCDSRDYTFFLKRGDLFPMSNKVSYKAQQQCKKLDSFFPAELPVEEDKPPVV